MEAIASSVPMSDYPPAPEHPAEIEWKGKSGKKYPYFMRHIDVAVEMGGFESCPANFVFAREVEPNQFVPVYIGETADLATVLEDHHTMRLVEFNRATHICESRSSGDMDERQAQKQDLVDYWHPICNR